MALVNLFNVPATDEEFLVYTFNIMDQSRRIVLAVQEQMNITLPLYPLDPPPPREQLPAWAMQLQQQVNGITNALNIQNFDFTDVDPDNLAEFAAWTYELGTVFRLANNQLGLGG